jgi:L-threonylcarbamoyladenylate synthase
MLGAAALNRPAVARLIEVTGRSDGHPLTVHVSSQQMLDSLVRDVPDAATRLMKAFWPGPLTLVLPSSRRVHRAVSAGTGTVAVRFPADPVALQLVRLTGQPIATLGLTLSGRPGITTAAQVVDATTPAELVIDGGPSVVLPM